MFVIVWLGNNEMCDVESGWLTLYDTHQDAEAMICFAGLDEAQYAVMPVPST